MAQGIKNTHKKGYQADKEDVGEGDTREKDRKLIFIPCPTKPKGLDSHYPRREENTGEGHYGNSDGKKG